MLIIETLGDESMNLPSGKYVAFESGFGDNKAYLLSDLKGNDMGIWDADYIEAKGYYGNTKTFSIIQEIL